MNVSANDLRRHYSVLTDEALLDLNPDDLTEIAQAAYQAEMFRRGLKRTAQPKPQEPEEPNRQLDSAEPQFSMESVSWAGTAVPVAEFEQAEEAQQARDVLEQAVIPCALATKREDPSLGNRRRSGGRWIVLMVPRSFLDAARERLRTQIDEPTAEDDYARHFVEFSDAELLDADFQALPDVGRKWYLAELEMRGLERSGLTPAPELPPDRTAEDGFVPVAALPQGEAEAARRFLERASIPCRIEQDSPQGGFETFTLFVPSAAFDDAAGILSRNEKDILGQEAEDKGLS